MHPAATSDKSMKTPVLIDAIKEPDTLAVAADALRAGEVVAFPTETVYGLGAHALDSEAVREIFRIKGRPATNPLIVHVKDKASAMALVSEWPAEADALADAFWPGPLTIVLPKSTIVPDEVTAGLDSVGIRVPRHPVARRLLELADIPIAAPSANPYTGVSPTLAEHVINGLPDLKYVVDGGATDVGLESTVFSLVGEPRILRPGMVTLSQIQKILPNAKGWDDDDHTDDVAARSPGLARKHYSPSARVIVADLEIRPMVSGTRVGVIRCSPNSPPILDALVKVLPSDADGYAQGLYSALHELDAAGCTTILIEPPPHDEAWGAVWNRIKRAAHS